MLSQVFATVALCLGAVSAHRPQSQYCVVDLAGTRYNQLALRPTPCNDQKPIMMLPNSLRVKSIPAPIGKGCGFTYKYISVRATDGKDYYGWVGTDYITCRSAPARPSPRSPPTMANPPMYQKCELFCVKNGGPTNCCGSAEFITGSHEMCAVDGSNCQAICCRPNPGPL